MGHLEDSIKLYAKNLGFNGIGITTSDAFVRDESAAIDRIREGFMAGMDWYTEERVHRSSHPNTLLPGAKSIISLSMSYSTDDPIPGLHGPTGKVARYAWGKDYHKVMKTRLRDFIDGLSSYIDQPIKSRIFVDDGAMIDRAVAERSGLGWFGKNTNILTKNHGSWVFLGQVITDIELKPDKPLAKTCGDCVICIDACPTGAIVAPYVINSGLCISFLTIELRGSIPRKLRPLIGDWIFGCDICQDVCPVNRKTEPDMDPAFRQQHDFAAPTLVPLLDLTDEGFRHKFKNSPIRRAKKTGLQRNVCVALGNIGDRSSTPALVKTLRSPDPVLREHAAWALGKLGGHEAIVALSTALAKETNQSVYREIELSLADMSPTDT